MKLARRLALIVLAAAAAVALAGTSARSAPQAANSRLVLVRLVRRAARLREVAGRPLRRAVRPAAAHRRPSLRPRRCRPSRRAADAAAPPQGVDYSGTNVQEEGVDEPDLVKTDGKTLFALANGNLDAVDVTRARSRACSTR